VYAGEIKTDKNGKVKEWNNRSGHFQPDKQWRNVIAHKFGLPEGQEKDFWAKEEFDNWLYDYYGGSGNGRHGSPGRGRVHRHHMVDDIEGMQTFSAVSHQDELLDNYYDQIYEAAVQDLEYAEKEVMMAKKLRNAQRMRQRRKQRKKVQEMHRLNRAHRWM